MHTTTEQTPKFQLLAVKLDESANRAGGEQSCVVTLLVNSQFSWKREGKLWNIKIPLSKVGLLEIVSLAENVICAFTVFGFH